MSPPLVMLLAFGAVCALMYALSDRTRSKVRGMLKGTPRVAIAQFVEGTPARVVGKVVVVETMAAPITRRPCVFWDIEADEWQSSSDSDGNDTSGFVNLLRRSGGVPFLVDDGTSRAYVDPEHAKAALELDAKILDGGLADPQDWGPAFLARHGISPGGKRLRFREGVIEAGEVVAIAGHGVREPDPAPSAAGAGYRDGPAMRLHLSGTADHPLLISDEPSTTA